MLKAFRLRGKGRFFLHAFLPAVVVIGLLVLGFYVFESKADIDLLKADEVRVVELGASVISHHFDMAVSDLMVAKSMFEHENILVEDLSSFKAHFDEDFLVLSKNKKTYDQVRFIDVNGMERVRVNFNNGNPVALEASQLQDKSDRYYFEEAINLGPSDLYISPFDLNIEHGEIEQPFKPMVRFAVPTFDPEGNKSGLIVLNFMGAKLIRQFQAKHAASHGDVMLINSDGYSLHSPHPDEEWGFMFPDGKDKTMSKRFPEAWHAIKAGKSGQIETDDGLFTYTTLYPLREGLKKAAGFDESMISSARRLAADAHYWKVVSRISPQGMVDHGLGLMQRSLKLFILLLLPVGAGCWLLAIVKEKSVSNEEHKAALVEALKAKNKELEQFAYSISHDLKTPLITIQGFLGRLGGDVVAGKAELVKDDIERLSSATTRMQAMLKDVLELSRIGRLINPPEEASLSALANEAMGSFSQQIIKDKVQVDVAEDMPVVCVDKARLLSVYENLIANALAHMEGQKKPHIEIGCRKDDGELVLFVRDNGEGIEPAFHDKIFNLFDKLDAKSPGTGVGLTLCKRIIEAHGGRIWVESAGKGKGSTFYFAISSAPEVI